MYDDDIGQIHPHEPLERYVPKSILGPMQELLRHEPETRISAREAAGLIEWTDHRRIKPQNSDEHEDEPDQEIRGKDE